jgi:hypothetical protein
LSYRDLDIGWWGPPKKPLPVLVWKVDPVTKKRHTALVPPEEAVGLERVKL